MKPLSWTKQTRYRAALPVFQFGFEVYLVYRLSDSDAGMGPPFSKAERWCLEKFALMIAHVLFDPAVLNAQPEIRHVLREYKEALASGNLQIPGLSRAGEELPVNVLPDKPGLSGQE